jgi:hypothetical protein
MKKLKLPLMSLMVCLIANAASACAANPPPALTATPVPSATPLMTPTRSSDIVTTGAFFALSVRDAEASADWYSEKLGLQVIFQPPPTNEATVIVLEGGGLIVELIQQTKARPLNEVAPSISNKVLLHGIFKVGVIVQDFENTLAILENRNIPIILGPFPATAEQRANVIIQDNEGNLIQFFGK